MTRYLVQLRDQIFIKDYGLSSLSRNMGKNVGKNISKNLNSKYSQETLDHAKQSATDPLKTASKTAIEKTAEATGDLIGNKNANRIRKVSKTSPQNNSVANIGKIHRERYISPEERQNY